MARVIDLIPGDLVTLGSDSAVFITRCEHPLYASVDLVVWRLAGGAVSLDALSPHQEVGEVAAPDRRKRLHAALRGEPIEGVKA